MCLLIMWVLFITVTRLTLLEITQSNQWVPVGHWANSEKTNRGKVACLKARQRHLLPSVGALWIYFQVLSLVWVCLTCLMIWPTYSITISSAAIGSIANRPHSWIWLGLKRILFFRNWYTSWQNETFVKTGSQLLQTLTWQFTPSR